jgi:hypothetical protein
MPLVFGAVDFFLSVGLNSVLVSRVHLAQTALQPRASGAFTTRSKQRARDFAFTPELFQQTNLCTPFNTSSP